MEFFKHRLLYMYFLIFKSIFPNNTAIPYFKTCATSQNLLNENENS